MRNRARISFFALAAASLFLSAHAYAADTTIKISQFAFSPASVEVAAGSKVTWVNEDKAAHSVISDTTGFSSEPLKQGDAFSMTFSTPGTYAYHCGFHSYMIGKVVVK